MDDLFNILSASARIDKSKRKKQQQQSSLQKKANSASSVMKQIKKASQQHSSSNSNSDDDDDSTTHSNNKEHQQPTIKSKRPKKQHSAQKLAQIHQEEINAFRRRVGIRLSSDNKLELETIPDPISSFGEWKCPTWWNENLQQLLNETKKSGGGSSSNTGNHYHSKLFHQLLQTIVNNIEQGRWKEPTPIQMQAVPSIMNRRDVMGCAPTGSGKSGAFVLPALMISKCPEEIYYGHDDDDDQSVVDDEEDVNGNNNNKKKKKKKQQQKQ